jgi:hypothetical protein
VSGLVGEGPAVVTGGGGRLVMGRGDLDVWEVI